MIEPTKLRTHLVMKRQDIEEALDKEEKEHLLVLINRISNHRLRLRKKPQPDYYVCNTDEPYANDVLSAILWGEGELSCELCANYGKHDDEVCYMCIHCESFSDHFERKEAP